MNLAFLDTETTGLDPTRHGIWEIAVIKRLTTTGAEARHLWQLNPDITHADPKALEIGRYHERHQLHQHPEARQWEAAYFSEHSYSGGPGEQYSLADFVVDLSSILSGCHLVGAVPSFDDAFLKPLFRAHGAKPTWHYHLIDVETLAAGYLAGAGLPIPPLPWNSDELSRAVGVEPDETTRHTALGDARWARAIYDAVTRRPAAPADFDFVGYLAESDTSPDHGLTLEGGDEREDAR